MRFSNGCIWYEPFASKFYSKLCFSISLRRILVKWLQYISLGNSNFNVNINFSGFLNFTFFPYNFLSHIFTACTSDPVSWQLWLSLSTKCIWAQLNRQYLEMHVTDKLEISKNVAPFWAPLYSCQTLDIYY